MMMNSEIIYIMIKWNRFLSDYLIKKLIICFFNILLDIFLENTILCKYHKEIVKPVFLNSFTLFLQFLWFNLFWLSVIDLNSFISHFPKIYIDLSVKKFWPRFKLLTLLYLHAYNNDNKHSSLNLFLISFIVLTFDVLRI